MEVDSNLPGFQNLKLDEKALYENKHWAVVVYTFNPSTPEAETGRCL